MIPDLGFGWIFVLLNFVNMFFGAWGVIVAIRRRDRKTIAIFLAWFAFP